MRALSFRVRILGGAVVSAMLAVALVGASMAVMRGQVARPIKLGVSPQMSAACEADPDRWQRQNLGEVQVLLMSADDPRVPSRVWDEPLGRPAQMREHPSQVWVRHASQGPCAVALFTLPPPLSVHPLVRGGGLVGVFFAMLAVGGASYGWTVVPLLARIERIRASVEAIGQETYVASGEPLADDLGTIALGVDASHARIVEARQELLARHEALERYLAEIAHDLRTPIGSLMLAIQEVEGATPTPSAARATTEVAYLSALVDNLHQATRLRHGLDLRRGQVDLRELVQRVELRFRALGRAQGVSVAASAPEQAVWVEAEPAMLERAIGNVVHNATLHGGSNVAILLDVDGGDFSLRVLDDGEGLSEEGLADLSRRTFSADPARRRGLGLGVAITNEVMTGLGWSVTYAQAEEGGLCVEIGGPLWSRRR